MEDDLQDQFKRAIRERLGIDPESKTARLIDRPRIAELAGVSKGTSSQWIQRSAHGQMHPPFPEPDPEATGAGKPLRDALAVCEWMYEAKRWPPASTARPTTRGPRKKRNAKPPTVAACPDHERCERTFGSDGQIVEHEAL